MAKKRNPQDSTRRNVQAANKRIASVTLRVRELALLLGQLAVRVKKLEGRKG